MKTLLHRVTLLVAWLPALAFGQGDPTSPIYATPQGRTLIRQTSTAGMRAYLGVSGLAAGDTLPPMNGRNLTNIYGTFDKSVWLGRTPVFFKTAASNQPNRVLFVGDSVAYKGEISKAFKRVLDSKMAAGGYGTWYTDDRADFEGASSTLYLATSQTSGSFVNAVNGDGVLWHWEFSNGQSMESLALAENGTTANQLSIVYKTDPAYGTLLVETQRVGGSWGTLSTINMAAATSRRATNYALTPLTNYLVRFTSTGNTYLHTFGLLNTTAQRSIAYAKYAEGGELTDQLITAPEFYTFFTNYNPTLVIVEAKDTAASMMTTMQWFKTTATNADVVFVTPSPNVPTDDGLTAQRYAMLDYGNTNGLAVYDKFGQFADTNYWSSRIYADGAHLSPNASYFAGAKFVEWLGLGSAGEAVGLVNSNATAAASVNLSTYPQVNVTTNPSGYLEIPGQVGTKAANGYFYNYFQTDLTRQMRIASAGVYPFLIYDSGSSTTIPALQFEINTGNIRINVTNWWTGAPKLGNLNPFEIYATTVTATTGITGNLATSTNYMGIKVWRGLVSQSGTAAPTATVLENSLPGTITWARTSAGLYTATLTGAFTANKTFATITSSRSITATDTGHYAIYRSDANTLTVKSVFQNPSSTSGNALADAMLGDTPVQILVYP